MRSCVSGAIDVVDMFVVVFVNVLFFSRSTRLTTLQLQLRLRRHLASLHTLTHGREKLGRLYLRAILRLGVRSHGVFAPSKEGNVSLARGKVLR